MGTQHRQAVLRRILAAPIAATLAHGFIACLGVTHRACAFANSRQRRPVTPRIALYSVAPPGDDIAVRDPYVVLGISRSATREEVKAHYKQLVRRYHPDVNPEVSPYMVQRVIRAAQSILGGQGTSPGPRQGVPPRRQRGAYSRAARRARARDPASEVGDAPVYSGFSRKRGTLQDTYRITTTGIEIKWAPRSRLQATRRMFVSFAYVRRISGHSKLLGNMYDLELELVWGTRVRLEQLPADVVKQVERIVEAVRHQYLARRSRMLARCVLFMSADKIVVSV